MEPGGYPSLGLWGDFLLLDLLLSFTDVRDYIDVCILSLLKIFRVYVSLTKLLVKILIKTASLPPLYYSEGCRVLEKET